MSLFQKFQQKPSSDILVVGTEGSIQMEDKRRDLSQLFFQISAGVVVAAIVFSFWFTGSVSDRSAFAKRQYYEILEQNNVEQQNLESLQLLAQQVEDIQKDFEFVEKAVPSALRADQILSYLEFQINQIKKQFYIESPSSVSWSLVFPQDISNDDLADLEVYSFSMPFLGTYEALLELLKSLRSHERLIDVRSIGGLQLRDDGFVQAELRFWTYDIPS